MPKEQSIFSLETVIPYMTAEELQSSTTNIERFIDGLDPNLPLKMIVHFPKSNYILTYNPNSTQISIVLVDTYADTESLEGQKLAEITPSSSQLNELKCLYEQVKNSYPVDDSQSEPFGL